MPGGPWLSWTRNLSCKSDNSGVHDPQEDKHAPQHHKKNSQHRRSRSRIQPIVHNPLFKANPISLHPPSTSSLRSSCNCSLSNLKDVVQGNTRVVHRASSSGSPHSKNNEDDSEDYLVSQDALFFEEDPPPEAPLRGAIVPSSSASVPSLSLRKKFSTCNGCNVAVDTMVSCKESSIAAVRNTCPQLSCLKCGDCFSRMDALEHHHTVQHAVSELPRGDNSRNIVEIIFRSSWTSSIGLPCGRIERVLKVHNSQRTLARFEDYRDSVKCRANAMASSTPASSKKASASSSARCVADGNELLRFFGTSLCCSLGAHGSSSLCTLPQCSLCKIIRSGFSSRNKAICTTATSSSAHQEEFMLTNASRRCAMIVCRVVAGRTLRISEDSVNVSSHSPPNGFDSLSVDASTSSSEAPDLLVFNPKAVLPCFVVIYKF